MEFFGTDIVQWDLSTLKKTSDFKVAGVDAYM